MITLTHLSSLNRTIVAGDDSTELYLALRRYGLVRFGLHPACRPHWTSCAVGLITVRNSFAAFEAALAQVTAWLGTTATIAVLVKSDESGFALAIRKALERIGFRIEAGVRSRQGLVVSAHRRGCAQRDRAA